MFVEPGDGGRPLVLAKYVTFLRLWKWIGLGFDSSRYELYVKYLVRLL